MSSEFKKKGSCPINSTILLLVEVFADLYGEHFFEKLVARVSLHG